MDDCVASLLVTTAREQLCKLGYITTALGASIVVIYVIAAGNVATLALGGEDPDELQPLEMFVYS